MSLRGVQARGKVSEKKRLEEGNRRARVDLLARVHGEYDHAADQLLELETAISQVERDRVLFRMLGNTSDSYVAAYYARLQCAPSPHRVTLKSSLGDAGTSLGDAKS